jgi:hypothetical protein
MWPNEAPAETTFPFITYAFISSAVEWTMASDFDMPLVQFSVWDNQGSPLRAMGGRDLLDALYSDQLLTITGSKTIRADKIGQSMLRDPDEGWQLISEFRYMIGTMR